MTKFAEFILTTFTGRVVLFGIIVVVAWTARLMGA